MLSAIRERGLVDRLVYGSDGPQRPGFVKDDLQRTLAAMDAAAADVDEAAAVLKGKPTTLVPLD